MDGYRKYSDELTAMINLASVSTSVVSKLGTETASDKLRQLVPRSKLRNSGAFFTGAKLSEILVDLVADSVSDDSIIIDPTCGAGDLLLAIASRFRVYPDLDKTLKHWADRLIGFDLHEEFVDVARKRLVLAAISRVEFKNRKYHNNCSSVFSQLTASSVFDNANTYKAASHVLLNPPYQLTKAPVECRWSSGLVSSAALFLENCLQSVKPGTQIVAILPDVLRSGARYGKWRAMVQSYSSVKRVIPYGRFDRHADVDVFVIHLEALKNRPSTFSGSTVWTSAPSSKVSLEDLYDIRIGAVVDYRSPKLGPWRPFAISRGLEKWATVKSLPNRRFEGSIVKPPFVVVRRTSRSNDQYRALATIINTKKSVAVENHLIVLKPKDGTIRSCKSLLVSLKDSRTNDWLNQRIRCRHLTVSSLKDLPFWS